MRKYKPYLRVLPVVAIVSFVLFLGIFETLIQSFGYFPFGGTETFTLDYYIKIFSNGEFLKSLTYTLYIALASSLLSIIIGVVLAFITVGLKIEKIHFFRIPVIIPHIIVALFAITFLSDSGFFARLLYNLGFENAREIFGKTLFNKNGVGIILSYMWKEIPYVLLTTYAVLSKLSGKHEAIARNLGADNFYSFRKITLPMLLPTILNTFTIIFCFSFGAYELPMLLGATVPKALPVMAFIEYQNPMLANRPYAMAINIVIVFICVFFTMIFKMMIEKLVGDRNE